MSLASEVAGYFTLKSETTYQEADLPGEAV
jgi:hypothetical protein